MQPMESSNPNKIFDEFRSTWVIASPEEKVRQRWLKAMVYEKGFPKNLLAIERELDQLPHVKSNFTNPPQRRIDILCFANNIHPHFPLYPLLLIECKEKPLDPYAEKQVIGYNHYVRAFFVGIADADSFRLGAYDPSKKDYVFINFLPSYEELLRAVKNAL